MQKEIKNKVDVSELQERIDKIKDLETILTFVRWGIQYNPNRVSQECVGKALFYIEDNLNNELEQLEKMVVE